MAQKCQNVPMCVQCTKFCKSVANTTRFLRKSLHHFWKSYIIVGNLWICVLERDWKNQSNVMNHLIHVDSHSLVACNYDGIPSPTFHHQMQNFWYRVEHSQFPTRVIAVLEIIDTILPILGGHRGAKMISFFEIATTCGPGDRPTTGAVTYNVLRPFGPKRCISFSPRWNTSVG